jgi:hypothetical protein
MRIAALTFAYNEAVNLPIWRRYYGQQFGEDNLFVVDHGSNDGSTDSLGDVSRIRLPRTPFDDAKKVLCLSSLQAGLLSHYDAIVCGDCDEIVVPDPEEYSGLPDYIARMEADYATCIGIDILHIIDQEPPIDLERSILSQRHFGRFQSVGCKTLVSRVPVKWEPGLHFSNRRPTLDRHLMNFHLKWMDYGTAVKRHMINQMTVWTDASLAANHGAHHRYDLDRFVREGFLDVAHLVRQGRAASFDLSDAIVELNASIIERSGAFFPQAHVVRIVEMPPRFRDVL